MSNRHKQLILELFLLRERYSQEEIVRACELIRSGKLGEEFSDLIFLLKRSESKPKTKNISQSSATNARYMPREEVIKRLKNSSQSIRYHLITDLSEKLGMDADGSQRPTIDEIIKKINTLSDREYIRKFSLKTDEKIREGSLEPDGDYLGLANFIMGVNRKIEEEK